MSDGLIHKLGWKIGTSRGTACGLEWDSPAMESLFGVAGVGKNRSTSPPFIAAEDATRVTCPACREKLAGVVGHALTEPDEVPF